jgi:hypothetical protein
VIGPDDAAKRVVYGKRVSAVDVLARGTVHPAGAGPVQQPR